MLIIEGADLVGKSTLVKKLYDEFDRNHLQHMPFHLTRVPNAWDAYHGYLRLVNPHSIWDRFHLSELVYRMHDERHTAMTPQKYRLVDAAVRAACGYVVVLYASDDLITRRWNALKREEMYPLEHVLKVNDTFRHVHTGIDVRGEFYSPHVDALHFVDDRPQAVLESIVEDYLAQWVDYREIIKR